MKITPTDYLLACLSEESSEISQQNGKISRFGLDDIYTHIDVDGNREVKSEYGSNRFRLISELNDLMAVVDMLVAEGVLPEDWECPRLKELKRAKILRYAKYSIEVGTLESMPAAAKSQKSESVQDPLI